MSKSTAIYTIPTAIDQSVADVIVKQLENLPLEEATVVGKSKFVRDRDVRKSRVQWINSDTWISGMMAHFVHTANFETFHYDLETWSERIQYTVYDQQGDTYGWHTDSSESPYYRGLFRKLSISLCLSDDYEGGELQIMDDNKMHSFKMKCGDAIVFPSDVRHRVRPIKSGKRISLVGWFSGPPFR